MCGHKWWPKQPGPPKQCTKCRSLRWDEAPPQGKEDHGLIDQSDLPVLDDFHTMQLLALKRWNNLTVHAMLDEAVDLYLSIPPDKLDDVRAFITTWNPPPGQRRSKQKEA